MSRARFGRVLALAAAASLALGACAARNDDGADGGDDAQQPQASAPAEAANAADPAGDGNAKCDPTTTLAYAGTINGQNAALGQNILNGVKLAVNRHNDANPDCQVVLKEFETEGTPDRAPGIVTQVVNTPEIIGVVGLPFSGESKAAGNIFDEKGLVQVTPSATNPALSENGWKTFFRGLGNDNAQGPAAAKFITGELGAQSVCVVRDDSEYGVGLANAISNELGDAASCQEKVKTKQTDFSAIVNSIKSANPDAIFYSGYYQEASPFAQQLYDAGVEATFVGPDGVKDDEFVKSAGDAAEGVYFTCPCVPADQFTEFTEGYKQLSGGKEPGTYSPEGYDIATILLKGIDSGVTDRAGLLEYVKNYEGQGLTKSFKWDEKGELAASTVWTYKVEDGKIIRNTEIKPD
ncbi:branched chain amino acid ABC transporter substrate-binding protein [Prauserella marina]|uniref:Branched-chain amino acid transport system substrate-binding protein n=1 Tax=Prauserella marina TaxID=530584 RepID=A0A222VTE2_9PSEU|nr:branched-chain amino acid ABC transporter substrate-binding protein [Prauserella marina]ASR37178.1 branched chain amino acid ABC transporter substrate-binding protein [Prauserella marina]PWV72490.1 amino acid/amide ABC transporter substrate-binding protein (HAAT family) [Prauserella marina]SDD78816.1 branched-chain amino acid transport system substrate-binding protein [Prauserella marina]